MRFSIASYAFHRELAAGRQDMLKYIQDSRDLGMAQLDPWNGHLSVVRDEDTIIKVGQNPDMTAFSSVTNDYLDKVKATADDAGLPFGCIAVDGAHIYDDDPAKRAQNRASAYRWIDVAQRLGAAQIRIDCGGTDDMPDPMFDIIVEGYNDLLKRTDTAGLELLIENHWGPSRHAHNLVKLFEAVPRVGLLFDTNNFPPEVREDAWATCAQYTRSVHIKTFEFDEHGNDPTMDFPKVIRLLADAGYQGVWGIESVPRDGDEYGAITKTQALITKVLSAE